MLERRWGKDRMNEYRRRNEAVETEARDYDDRADQGEIKPIYQFGEGVVEGEDLTLSDREIHIPGFGKPVILALDNPWEDMTGD